MSLLRGLLSRTPAVPPVLPREVAGRWARTGGAARRYDGELTPPTDVR